MKVKEVMDILKEANPQGEVFILIEGTLLTQELKEKYKMKPRDAVFWAKGASRSPA